jgi:hypothetical protein
LRHTASHDHPGEPGDASAGRRLVVLGILSLLGSGSLTAETSTEKWIQRYDGIAAGRDYPNAVAVDREGNVAVTGMSDDEQNRSNPLTLKYASDTGELLWENRFCRAATGALQVRQHRRRAEAYASWLA